MLHTSSNTSLADVFKQKPDTVLQEELKVLLCMSNGGGTLANDILNELDKRANERQA